MSFVLDALKVSERRRSRFSRRLYAHPPRPRPAVRRRNWLVALGVSGAIALVVAGWTLVAPAPGPLSPSAPPGSSGAPLAGVPSRGNSAAPAKPVPAVEDSPALNVPEPAGAAQMNTPDEPGRTAAANNNASGKPGTAGAARGMESQHGRSGQIAAAGFPAPGGSAARNPASRPASTRVALTAAPPDWPALSLQMLFFSENENRSFVQVNGRTYRQGEQLAAGPRVLTITKDAVTLSYRGQLLLLGAER